MDTEEKYPEIREKLKKLPRIKARDDFLGRLLNKITLLENQSAIFSQSQKEEYDKNLQSEKTISQKVLEKFTRRKPVWNWLIPTVSFAVILLVIFSYLLVLRNTDNIQEPIQTPQVKIETANKTPSMDEKKTDLAPPEIKGENLQYTEGREEPTSKKEIITKEIPRATNEAGMVAPLERKEIDLKADTKPPVNGKNNDGKDEQVKLKKDEEETKIEDKNNGETKGKVEVSKTRSTVIPVPKKKTDIEKDGLIDKKKKPQLEIKPDSIKK